MDKAKLIRSFKVNSKNNAGESSHTLVDIYDLYIVIGQKMFSKMDLTKLGFKLIATRFGTGIYWKYLVFKHDTLGITMTELVMPGCFKKTGKLLKVAKEPGLLICQ